MFRVNRWLRTAALAMTLAVGTFAMSDFALGAKIHLKDGRVLEGTIVREGTGFVQIRINKGGIETVTTVSADEIRRIERDSSAGQNEPVKKDEPAKNEPQPAPSADAPKAEPAKAAETPKASTDTKGDDAKASSNRHTGATRVAILHFGPPTEWQGSAGDMVGVQISAEAFKDAVPMLKKEKVDVVVIRVNSGGGYTLERDRFQEVFEKQYKPNFRTVAWIDSAISAAAMSPWVIEEFYFLPNGNIGGCTQWSGAMVASKGVSLEMILAKMEDASRLGKKDPKIMRAMQIMEPLSVDFDAAGNVVWRQDDKGQFVINPVARVLTMNAQDAVKFGVGKGIASTKEELAKAMGLQEVEWVAQNVTKFVDDNIRENDRAEKRNREVFNRYQLALQLADEVDNKQQRGQQLAIAKRALAEIRRFVQLNPNLMFHFGVELSPEWFEEQEAEIKRIASKP